MVKLIIIIPNSFRLFGIFDIFNTEQWEKHLQVLVIVVIMKNLYLKLVLLLSFSQCKPH